MRPNRRQFLVSTTAAGALTLAPRAATRPSMTPTMTVDKHIVLLGDSIFDNGSYVPGKPSVIDQLAAAVGAAGKATLLARDGDVTADVADQLAGVPADATHLVISVGGNDALDHTALLDKKVGGTAELFAELAAIHEQFRAAYAAMLAAVTAKGRPTAVCTIYDSNYDQPRKRLADVALSVWNDAILRCAFAAGVPVIDLRKIFRDRKDYANPIEPSEIGGAAMVKAIVQATDEHDFATRRTSIYG